MHRLFPVLGFFALLTSCTSASQPKDGTLPCDNGCPSGYVCRADNRCWSTNAPLPADGGVEALSAAKDVPASHIGAGDGAPSREVIAAETGNEVAEDSAVVVADSSVVLDGRSDEVSGAGFPDAAVGRDAYVASLDTAATLDGGGATDTTAPDPYVWITIQDTEPAACTTNGPGADIDAVALWASTGPIGWGRKDSAHYTPNPYGYACDNADCTGGNCKYASTSMTIPLATLLSYTEGPADAVVSAIGDDTGYLSLNAGALQIQMGDIAGEGPAQAMKSGYMIKVFEVDKTYIANGHAPANCTCRPEHYTVTLQTAKGTALPLTPIMLAADNTSCDPLTGVSIDGCGTTVFLVP